MKDELLKILRLQLILLILLMAAGCNPFQPDPETTVTIEIYPITRSSDRHEVMEILRRMTDKASNTMHIQSDSDTMRVTLSPVNDVGEFARRITFGHVREVKNRTIIVEYPHDKVFI